MKLGDKNFFKKNISRYIETVIKADDKDNISDEVAEYVITKEIEKKIQSFFATYNNFQGVNGVWISGFFGSGKSHLLKILSYVLENRKTDDGYNCGELFAAKIERDDLLKADIERAARTPSASILFNIDQQAQITSKQDANAILGVFYKVFYDHLDFYGFRPHVAEFEMWLDRDGHYDTFKQKFEQKANKTWKEARIDYFDPLVTDTAAEALGEIFDTDASKYEDILDGIEDRQKHSILDFCEKVNAYIESKEKGFRLNFFVDEIGQYISDNTKLMLNLQTIAETLATQTKGKAWILVTSQEDMEQVVGDMNKAQMNDFSRIQARFKLKVPLTSANVDEVIEKRLLDKKEGAKDILKKVYEKEQAHLSTLLRFSDVGIQFKGFSGEKDFVNKYPFIPYQFDLFQNCRRALSNHNAFQGRHASVGERSMLGVFQHVACQILDKGTDALISFDSLYEGIRNELRGEMQSAITTAERNVNDKFALRVLKALFLVKYFNNFKADVHNIAVLLIDQIDIDLSVHDEKVRKALNLLENQSYIQRNGELYEYLTDDEKDIEQEIKSTDIEDTAVNKLLKEVIFDEIIRDSKLKYKENNQEYEFCSKIDGVLIGGREKELIIDIITPQHENYDNVEFIKMQSLGYKVMRMRLPENERLLKDAKMLLKTNKYVKQSQSTTNKETVKRILFEKQQQNKERRSSLLFLLNDLIGHSDVYINGGLQQMQHANDGKTKAINAFQNLIKFAFPNLRMLGQVPYSENTIKEIMNSQKEQLFAANDTSMSEGESEVLNTIQRRKKQSDRTYLSDLKTIFTKGAYGWYPNAIWSLVAKLYKRGKIEVRQDGTMLNEVELLGALFNSRDHGNTYLDPQMEIDYKKVKALKDIYSEAFDETCSMKEARDVANAFKEKLRDLKLEVKQLLDRRAEYPFLSSLDAMHEELNHWTNKEYIYYLTNQKDFENTLLDYKEDYFAPIKTFWNGDQRKIYDDVRKMLNSDTSNFGYIEGNEVEQLKELLSNKAPYKGSAIKDAKALKDSLTQKVLTQIEAERTMAINEIETLIESLKGKTEFSQLEAYQQSQLIRPFERAIDESKVERYVASIRRDLNLVKDHLFTKQLNEMIRLTTKEEEAGTGAMDEPKVHYIRKSNIKVSFDKNELATEEDVEAYMTELKAAYLDKITNNKRILL